MIIKLAHDEILTNIILIVYFCKQLKSICKSAVGSPCRPTTTSHGSQPLGLFSIHARLVGILSLIVLVIIYTSHLPHHCKAISGQL